MNRHIILAISLALNAGTSFGYGYQANTGALSYTFFNLSPNPVTLTPKGGGVNSSGQSGSFAVSQGWGNVDGTVGVFNPVNLNGSCNNPSTQVTYNTVWYNETPGRIAAPGAISLNAGSPSTSPLVEYAGSTSPIYNAPAIADSWVLSGNGNTIVMANMASAPNMFISNAPGASSSDYPFCASQSSQYFNADINPPQPNPNLIGGTYGGNPLGSGFVATGQTMNFNPASTSAGYIGSGGLWSGFNNPNTANLAVNTLNLSMYPVNLSSYVQSPVVNSGIGQTAAPIYGGHFTLSFGDPFLVSSYAAKILWYIVTNNGYAFSNNSLTTHDLGTLQNLVAPPSGNGVFESASNSAQYAKWLLQSPNLAQSAISMMNTAASKPITHESVWGKVINATLKTVTNSLIEGADLMTGGEASVALVVAQGAAETTVGAYGSDVTDAITASFTSTSSLPPPVSQQAPLVVNNSYSSSNLLGLLLTNSIVQATINNAEGLDNQSGAALWSNDSINTDNLCNTMLNNSSATTTVSVTANLITGPCFTTNSSGGLTSTTVANDGTPSTVQSYTNVLSLYPNSQSSTSINLWDAILTGSDITTVQSSSASNNGYMQVANPTIAAFSPPTQLVNAVTTTTTNPLNVSGVNTTFNLATGMVSLASYTAPLAGSSPPAAVPNLSLAIGTPPMANQGIQFALPNYWGSPSSSPLPGYYAYNFGAGILYVNGYYGCESSSCSLYGFANGQQTLNMTACPEGAGALLTINANPDNANAYGASGSLSCQTPAFPIAVSGSPIPGSAPAINTFITPMSNVSIYAPNNANDLSPAQIASLINYNATTGALTVNGYGYSTNSGTQTVTFQNGSQTLDMTTCSPTSNVTLTVYPFQQTAGSALGSEANGYLTCQSPPTLPYNACTNDPQATGGLIVAVTTAPASDGTGAAFQIGCACIPSYLGGTGGGTSLGNVFVGATSINPTGSCN